jgi:hypothetical protein
MQAVGHPITKFETRPPELNIRKQGEDLQARRGGERITIDSATGQVIEARDTRGGGFLYRFHFELYGFDRIWARWISRFSNHA